MRLFPNYAHETYAESVTPLLRNLVHLSRSLEAVCLKRSRLATMIICTPTNCDCESRSPLSPLLCATGHETSPLMRASRRSFRERTLAFSVILGFLFLGFFGAGSARVVEERVFSCEIVAGLSGTQPGARSMLRLRFHPR
jgi:hypothetical protein